MDMINDQVLLLKIETEVQIRKYKRAVCYEAAALICEDNLILIPPRQVNRAVKTNKQKRSHCVEWSTTRSPT
jgi:hypothetical protein